MTISWDSGALDVATAGSSRSTMVRATAGSPQTSNPARFPEANIPCRVFPRSGTGPSTSARAGSSSARSDLRERSFRSIRMRPSSRWPSPSKSGATTRMQSPSRSASSVSGSFPASAVRSSSPNTARPMRNFCSRELNRRTTSWPTQMLGGRRSRRP